MELLGAFLFKLGVHTFADFVVAILCLVGLSCISPSIRRFLFGNNNNATKEQLQAHEESDQAIAKAFGDRCDRIERKMDEVKAQVEGISTGIQLALGIADKRRKNDDKPD